MVLMTLGTQTLVIRIWM